MNLMHTGLACWHSSQTGT